MSLNWDWACCLFVSLAAVSAQTTASLRVEVLAPDRSSIPSAEVRLVNRSVGFNRLAVREREGAFVFTSIPTGSYVLSATAPGFAEQRQNMTLRTSVPVDVTIALPLAAAREQVTVGANERADLLDAASTGTHAGLSDRAMEQMPAPASSRGLERYLLAFPGFAMNANGAIHPRGAHNQMTYVVDGMPISDQLTGAFATSLDSAIVANLELYTGDVPAEFGAKVSGVAVVSTQTGSGRGRRVFGAAEIAGGSFDTARALVQAGGERGRFAWFGSVSATRTHRFLDQVSLDNLHNGGNSQRGFLRLDYQASERDSVRLNVMSGRSGFELANLRSQQAAGMDQRQLLRDASIWLHWSRTVSPASTWETTAAYRPSIAQLMPSAGDTPVTAAQARHLNTATVATRFNRIAGVHSIRTGADLQRFYLSENFSLGITSALFNPPDSGKFNDALATYDLTRGGGLFNYHSKGAGTLGSAFFQDWVRLGPLTLSLGARYDDYAFLVRGRQFQPRVGLALNLPAIRTVMRASYNRNYQTPPNENLLLSSSVEAARLAPAAVRARFGGTAAPLRPQRENVIEAGVEMLLPANLKLNAAYYHKNSRDQQDNNNFFESGIIFPVTLSRIRVNGAEARLIVPERRGLSGSLAATHSHAVTTPPFTGGLFLGQDSIDLLSSGPFVIDHDQLLSVVGNATYELRRAWIFSALIRYDSGLVANPTTPLLVAQSPDYQDLISLIRFGHTPTRVRPRTITDISAGYRIRAGDRVRWEIHADIGNIQNRNALYNFQSVFVGTRVVSPRSVSLRVRTSW